MPRRIPHPTLLPGQVELAVESPLSRAFASVNVRPEDKAIFDAMQAFFSYRRGRSLRQWEVFSLVLAEAMENHAGELRAGRFRCGP